MTTDKRVISLDERRPKTAAPVSGVASLSNDAFQLPFMKTHHEPRWTATGVARLSEDASWPIDASLVAQALDEDAPLGWVSRNEHRLVAEFVVGPEHAEMIQKVALSPVGFDVLVAFSADEFGAVARLELSIIRKDPT